jgi:hypothetical protein
MVDVTFRWKDGEMHWILNASERVAGNPRQHSKVLLEATEMIELGIERFGERWSDRRTFWANERPGVPSASPSCPQ